MKALDKLERRLASVDAKMTDAMLRSEAYDERFWAVKWPKLVNESGSLVDKIFSLKCKAAN